VALMAKRKELTGHEVMDVITQLLDHFHLSQQSESLGTALWLAIKNRMVKIPGAPGRRRGSIVSNKPDAVRKRRQRLKLEQQNQEARTALQQFGQPDQSVDLPTSPDEQSDGRDKIR